MTESAPNAEYAGSSRQLRALSDRVRSLEDELARGDSVLEAARLFGAEQAERADRLQRELDELRGTRLFRYSRPARSIYGRTRKLYGRARRRIEKGIR